MPKEGPNIKGEHVFTGDFRESEEPKDFYAEDTPLTWLFGENPRIKILAAFLSEAGKDMRVSDIARLAGVSRSTAYNHIDYLVEIGAVRPTRKIGGSTLYEVDTENEIVQHIMKIEREALVDNLEI